MTALHLRNYFISFLIIAVTALTFSTKDTLAAVNVSNQYTGDPASFASKPACPSPNNCDDAPDCANSQNRNNCGLPTCDGGNAWTRYAYSGICYVDTTSEDPITGETTYNCKRLYKYDTAVYSIGDKCTSGGPYLNPGYCESAFGGPIYKTCCSSDGNALSPFQCVPFNADNAGDPEGRCPGGYQREVFCGQPGQPECGQPACGPTGPAKTCDPNRTYNECCGNNLSRSVTEYTWSDGTGVCNYNAGECKQADPACAGATPPPPPPTPPPPTPPPADTEIPKCVYFRLNGGTSASVKQGENVTIGTQISDNVWVQNVQFFRNDGSNLIQTFNPVSNPFETSYSYDTSPLTPGNYTIIANAQDSSGNSMFGNDVNCKGALTITPAAIPVVSCSASPNPASSGAPVTFTATPGGGSGVYSSYVWRFDDGTTTTTANSTTSKTYTNAGPGPVTKTAYVKVIDSAGQTSTEKSCTVTINPPGALIVTPSAQCVIGSTTHQTISASWNLISASSYLLDLKSSGGSIGGADNCITSGNSFTFTTNSPYSITGSYTVYVTAYSGPNCTGSIVANAQKGVTNASCSATPPPTPPPTAPPTGTCDPAIDSKVSGCTTSVNIGCQLVGGAPTVWCQSHVGSDRVCQYCPPPPPPPSCNTKEPPNDAPTVTLRPDGHTLDIVYKYAIWSGEPEGVSTYRAPDNLLQKIWQEILKVIGVKDAFGASSVPEIRGTIYRSNQHGFIESSGTEIGTQFGLFGISFDIRPPKSTQRLVEYYQVNAISGENSIPSNTIGVVIGLDDDNDCDSSSSIFGSLRPSLVSACQISPSDPTAKCLTSADPAPDSTRVTFKLVYDWRVPGGFTGPRVNPTYLKINRSSSSTPGYIKWDSSTKVEKVCTENYPYYPYNCTKEKYTVTYMVDLPPATSDNLTITGYNGTGCSDTAQIGTVSFTGKTQAGVNPDPVPPTLSAVSTYDAEDSPMVTMDWNQTQSGEVVKVKRSNDRWSGTSISSTSRGTYADGIWTFKATDDLASLPRGKTYYYGVQLDLFSLVGTGCHDNQRDVKSEQTPFYWDYSPWVKTINGDVHSQTGINTPGGP